MKKNKKRKKKIIKKKKSQKKAKRSSKRAKIRKKSKKKIKKVTKKRSLKQTGFLAKFIFLQESIKSKLRIKINFNPEKKTYLAQLKLVITAKSIAVKTSSAFFQNCFK